MIKVADIDAALQLISNEAVRPVIANQFEELLALGKAQAEEIQRLRDELNRLKGEQGKPDFKPGKGSPKKDDSTDPAAKGDKEEPRKPSSDTSSEGERKKPKTWQKGSKADRIEIHQTQFLDQPPPGLPWDAVAIDYVPHAVQDILVTPRNTLFYRASWYSPSTNTTYSASLPPGYFGDFGPGLRTLIPTLHFMANVSQPCIQRFVQSAGITISSGTISNFITKGTSQFYSEYDDIFRAGLLSSPWQGTDHTTSPVNGMTYQCQVIGNPLYTVYATGPGKSRRSVIKVLLNVTHSEKGSSDQRQLSFLLNERAYKYLSGHGCPCITIDALKNLPQGVAFDEDTFLLLVNEHLTAMPKKAKTTKKADGEPKGPSQLRLDQICDAAAVAYYHAQQEWPVVDTILSDDDRAFAAITDRHVLCWVHDGRLYKKLVPFLPDHLTALDLFLARYWEYYDSLLHYKQEPAPEAKQKLSAQFDTLFSTMTGFNMLDSRIAATLAKKELLLLVLEHPELPLHNNASELAARARVRKRDVSLQTRTPAGTRAWDTMMTLTSTAQKLGVNLYHYLYDRISQAFEMPSLASLIAQQAAIQNLGASWNTS